MNRNADHQRNSGSEAGGETPPWSNWNERATNRRAAAELGVMNVTNGEQRGKWRECAECSVKRSEYLLVAEEMEGAEGCGVEMEAWVKRPWSGQVVGMAVKEGNELAARRGSDGEVMGK